MDQVMQLSLLHDDDFLLTKINKWFHQLNQHTQPQFTYNSQAPLVHRKVESRNSFP